MSEYTVVVAGLQSDPQGAGLLVFKSLPMLNREDQYN